eukprot:CAMPEP_0171462584 /NCGR_PEP_ID=MMETSP0945-20130129/6562_1 /TAXON_ID=109269 /ORGANISM="Vaucheria litorea, Strain CCMP2940" /LENGTH=407 /DNA_ID=CAMNT_0011989137 /DNA_START=54 /DNA_END=1277 /DNA_ORIENTATION=-
MILTIDPAYTQISERNASKRSIEQFFFLSFDALRVNYFESEGYMGMVDIKNRNDNANIIFFNPKEDFEEWVFCFRTETREGERWVQCSKGGNVVLDECDVLSETEKEIKVHLNLHNEENYDGIKRSKKAKEAEEICRYWLSIVRTFVIVAGKFSKKQIQGLNIFDVLYSIGNELLTLNSLSEQGNESEQSNERSKFWGKYKKEMILEEFSKEKETRLKCEIKLNEQKKKMKQLNKKLGHKAHSEKVLSHICLNLESRISALEKARPNSASTCSHAMYSSDEEYYQNKFILLKQKNSVQLKHDEVLTPSSTYRNSSSETDFTITSENFNQPIKSSSWFENLYDSVFRPRSLSGRFSDFIDKACMPSKGLMSHRNDEDDEDVSEVDEDSENFDVLSFEGDDEHSMVSKE